MYGCLRSSFTIYSHGFYRTMYAIPAYPARARALRIRYTGTVISSFTFSSCFLSKGGTDFILDEFVDIMVLGGLLLYIQSFI